MTIAYMGRHSVLSLEYDLELGFDEAPPAKSGRYTVQVGDTLASIAARYGLEGGWQALYEKNLWILGGNPNDLMPGQHLAL